jgi:hypothetical protein
MRDAHKDTWTGGYAYDFVGCHAQSFDRAGPRLVEWVVPLLTKQLFPVEDHSHRFVLIG